MNKIKNIIKITFDFIKSKLNPSKNKRIDKLTYDQEYFFEYVYDSITMPLFANSIKKYISYKENLNIFEIGSRDGKDGRFFKSEFPNSTVYAFEAQPEEYRINAIDNDIINWINLAIYNKDGRITFHSKSLGSGIHSIRDRGQEYGTETVEVQCKKIKTFCSENNIEKIDIAKIDVEGCTLEVLESFEDLLQHVKFLHIETETVNYFENQHLESEVFSYLKNNNFKLLMRSELPNFNQHDSVWINGNLFKKGHK